MYNQCLLAKHPLRERFLICWYNLKGSARICATQARSSEPFKKLQLEKGMRAESLAFDPQRREQLDIGTRRHWRSRGQQSAVQGSYRQQGHPAAQHRALDLLCDLKQAYERVPRAQLWRKLEKLGYGASWRSAVQALYADVPIAVTVPGLKGRVFQATQGLKQGCPHSPMLFNLYIADHERGMLTAASRSPGF